MANLVWALAIQESNNGGGSAAGGVIVAIMGLIWLALVVLLIATFWKLFSKAGEPGWASIVPIYSFIVLLKISSMPWWWLFLAPIAAIIIPFKLAANFGKGTGFAVGLLVLGIIFFPMLAFGSAQYRPQA
jgi:hypothetical protein